MGLFFIKCTIYVYVVGLLMIFHDLINNEIVLVPLSKYANFTHENKS